MPGSASAAGSFVRYRLRRNRRAFASNTASATPGRRLKWTKYESLPATASMNARGGTSPRSMYGTLSATTSCTRVGCSTAALHTTFAPQSWPTNVASSYP